MTFTIKSSIKWGLLWGLAWGFTLLAPQIVRTHYMSGTPWEAVKMAFVIGAIFAFLGVGIAIGIYVIALIIRVTGRDRARMEFHSRDGMLPRGSFSLPGPTSRTMRGD